MSATAKTPWASFGGRRGARPEAPPRPVTVLVSLTTWAGATVTVRYTDGRDFPMEPAVDGGSYVYFSSGMVYVREGPMQIRHRLRWLVARRRC